MYADRVFRHHAVPQSIVSGRDTRLTNLLWRELAKRLGTELHVSTAYHPQTDGHTERVNGVLEDTLRHFVGPHQNDWDDLLAPAEFVMNNLWHHSIRNVPFMLIYGQLPGDPTVAKLRSGNPAVNTFVGTWSDQLARAKLCLEAAQQRMKHYADAYPFALFSTRGPRTTKHKQRQNKNKKKTQKLGFAGNWPRVSLETSSSLSLWDHRSWRFD